MILVDAKCKICGKSLKVKIANDYATLGDQMKLIPMATCNPCYDNREDRRKVESKIAFECSKLSNNPKMDMGKKNEVRSVLTVTTQNYARLIASQRNLENVYWKQDFVDQLMDTPEKQFIILQHFRKMVPMTYAPREAAEARTPHND